MKIQVEGVREYSEGMAVEIDDDREGNLSYPGFQGHQPLLIAYNEGGYNHTAVDLFDLLAWVQDNRPDWLLMCRNSAPD